jgi:predicted nucleic acid-binding Zn finger protein
MMIVAMQRYHWKKKLTRNFQSKTVRLRQMAQQKSQKQFWFYIHTCEYFVVLGFLACAQFDPIRYSRAKGCMTPKYTASVD